MKIGALQILVAAITLPTLAHGELPLRPTMADLKEAGFEIKHIAAAEREMNTAWVFFLSNEATMYFCPLVPPIGMGSFYLDDDPVWSQAVSCSRFLVSVESDLIKENN